MPGRSPTDATCHAVGRNPVLHGDDEHAACSKCRCSSRRRTHVLPCMRDRARLRDVSRRALAATHARAAATRSWIVAHDDSWKETAMDKHRGRAAWAPAGLVCARAGPHHRTVLRGVLLNTQSRQVPIATPRSGQGRMLESWVGCCRRRCAGCGTRTAFMALCRRCHAYKGTAQQRR